MCVSYKQFAISLDCEHGQRLALPTMTFVNADKVGEERLLRIMRQASLAVQERLLAKRNGSDWQQLPYVGFFESLLQVMAKDKFSIQVIIEGREPLTEEMRLEYYKRGDEMLLSLSLGDRAMLARLEQLDCLSWFHVFLFSAWGVEHGPYFRCDMRLSALSELRLAWLIDMSLPWRLPNDGWAGKAARDVSDEDLWVRDVLDGKYSKEDGVA
jgi:hypothetical protein